MKQSASGMWRRLVSVAFIAGLLASAGAVRAQDVQTGQTPQKFEKGSAKLGYFLFIPADYNTDKTKKYPLVMFLHGSGERGEDLKKVKVHGIPKVVDKQKDCPFIAVSPQCPGSSWWNANDLAALLDDIQARYRVDVDRVYLTGLSMGGFGTWDMASKFPDRFAAIVPICGGGDPKKAEAIKNIPIWVFHGDADKAVPVKRSDDMVDALKAAGATVKYTRYEGVGHDCWTRSYDNPELYTWLLAQKRSKR